MDEPSSIPFDLLLLMAGFLSEFGGVSDEVLLPLLRREAARRRAAAVREFVASCRW